jgi:hypothetical protein
MTEAARESHTSDVNRVPYFPSPNIDWKAGISLAITAAPAA